MVLDSLDAEDLLKIILVLVVIWLALEVLSLFVELLLGLFPAIVGIVIVALIALWFFDKL